MSCLPSSLIVPLASRVRYCYSCFNILLNLMRTLTTTSSAVLDPTQYPPTQPPWIEEKLKYLQMDKKSKRQEYKCGENFVTLSDIKTWREHILNRLIKAKKINRLAGNNINSQFSKILSEKISVFRGDITRLEIDAIVNTSRKTTPGSGVEGLTHLAGPYLLAENKAMGVCLAGEVKLTGGYQLPADYVISTVYPVGKNPEKLGKCYSNSIAVLINRKLKTIAYPSISTTLYGYPIQSSVHIALNEVRQLLEKRPDLIERVIFCYLSNVEEEIYTSLLQSYFPLR